LQQAPLHDGLPSDTASRVLLAQEILLMHSFLIPDMTCGHCASVIKTTLLNADTQARLEIDLAQHLLRIDSQLGISQILTLLEEAGYSPTIQGH